MPCPLLRLPLPVLTPAPLPTLPTQSQLLGQGSCSPCHLSWDPPTTRLTHPGAEQSSGNASTHGQEWETAGTMA